MGSFDFVVFAVSLTAVVSADITTSAVKKGDCVCATTNVNARNRAGLNGLLLLIISSGQCATASGASRRLDGYKWYQVNYSGQTLWVAGLYFNQASASFCFTPSSTVRDDTSTDDHAGTCVRRGTSSSTVRDDTSIDDHAGTLGRQGTTSSTVRDDTSIDDHAGTWGRQVSVLEPALIGATVILAIILFSLAAQMFLSCKIIRYIQTRLPPTRYSPIGSQTGMSEVQKSERLDDQNYYAQF